MTHQVTTILAFAVLFASCQSLAEIRNTPPELQGVYEEVTPLVATDAVRLDVQSGRYLRIGIINSPLRNLPSAEKRARALDIATRAYMRYGSRSALRTVDVTFIVQGTRFFFLPYEDGRDSFQFATSDLDPEPTALREGWVPPGTVATDLYFIAIGDAPTEFITDLVEHFQQKLGISITLLPPLSFDRATFDPTRSQLIADELVAAVRFRHATLARNPRTRVIGITPYDMYMKATRGTWRFTFSLRSHQDTFAVVSYARMDPVNLGEAADEEVLESRLRKMVAKNIGIICYGLPLSKDPRSVLYGNILGVEELDYMSEFFEPRE